MLIKSKEKKERALGAKLFLKAHRCNSPKCALTRRPYGPGVHGKKRRSFSEYAKQLRAKQRVKLSYGVNEAQLKTLFQKISRKSGATGDAIIIALERRLDNAVFRAGLAPSRLVARRLISHGHFLVNGKKSVSPSYLLSIGDSFTVKQESRGKGPFKELQDVLAKFSPPQWLKIDSGNLEAKVVALPQATDSEFDIGEVVEFFSKNN